MKFALVGEANRAGGPPFSGRSGRRLADLLGISPDQLPIAFNLTNLFEHWPGGAGPGRKGDRFPMTEAQTRAATWLKRNPETVVILAGKRLARAFDVRPARYLSFFDQAGRQFAIIPHPSGVNHWWNDDLNARRAKRFLVETARDSVRCPRAHSLTDWLVLCEIRSQIDSLDVRLSILLEQRVRASRALQAFKAEVLQLSTHDPKREREILQRFPSADVRAIMQRILEVSRGGASEE